MFFNWVIGFLIIDMTDLEQNFLFKDLFIRFSVAFDINSL